MHTRFLATTEAPAPPAGTIALVRRVLAALVAGEADDFARLVHPDAVDHDAVHAPPGCRGQGPAAFLAMARWLREAFADLDWEVHEAVTAGDLVVLDATMSGRHVGPFVRYDDVGRVERVFAPTRRPFAMSQSHWFRVEDDLVICHRSNGDDLGMAMQLGWLRSSPAYALRCARANRRAGRRAT